ncbi:hypothetical protein [Streptomyces pratensis]|uniref:hypothetical protein n=1 Tax=Streptomyces pratensis TaxID=1169025 RepID=UPI00301A1A4B
MGLMSWLWGDRGRADAETAPANGAEDHAADGATAAAVTRGRGDRVDVHRIAPLQRLVSDQRLTVDPARFEGSLTTRQDTALGMPLGHLVSPEAPGGLVLGLSAPVEPSADRGASPAPVTAQRSADMPLRGAAAGRGGGAGSAAAPVAWSGPAAVQRTHGVGAPAMTSAGPTAADAGGVDHLPVRRLVGGQPLVPKSAPPAPKGPSAPSAPPSVTGADTPSAHPFGSPSASLSASASGSGAGGARVQRAVSPPGSRPPRRAPGLGAPLPGLPPTARRGDGVDAPAAAQAPADPGLPEVSRTAEGEAPAAPLLGDDPLLGPGAPGTDTSLGPGTGPARPLPGDTSYTAPPAGPSGSSEGAVGGPPGGRGGSLQRSAAPSGAPPAAGPVTPLLGDRPLVPRNVDVQRAAAPAGGPAQAAAGPAQAAAGPGAGGGGASGAVPVRWAMGADGGTGTGSAFRSGSAVPIGPAPPPSVPSPPPAPLQRQAAGGPPVPASVARARPGSGGGRGLPSAGAVAVAAGVAQRMADGSVVFGSARASGASRPVVQRDAGTVEEPPPPEPDPVTEPGPVTESDPATWPDAEAGADGGGGPEPPGGGSEAGSGAPAVTDELVRALYAPLSRLLRNDLRLERERAGLLINTRH